MTDREQNVARRNTLVMGMERTQWNVSVICFSYMVSKSLVMAIFTFIAEAMHDITGHTDAAEGVYLLAVLKLGSAAMALPISKFFILMGRFKGFVTGFTIILAGLMVILVGMLTHNGTCLFVGAFFVGGGAAVMNFLRFAVAEVCVQDAVGKGLALTYVQGAAIGAAVIGPMVTVLSSVIFDRHRFMGVIFLLSVLVVTSMAGLSTVQFPPLSGNRALVIEEIKSITEEAERRRHLWEIVCSSSYVMAFFLQAVGTSMMIAYMAVMPLVMIHDHGFFYNVMSLVMMVHMLGMNATSYVTGPLIFKIGLQPVIFLGIALYFISWLSYFFGGANQPLFFISSFFQGAAWNLLSGSAGLIVLGTTRKSEADKKPTLQVRLSLSLFAAVFLSPWLSLSNPSPSSPIFPLQSIFDFLNYLLNGLYVLLVGYVYFHDGWIGVLYCMLTAILLMVAGVVWVKIAGLDSNLDLDKLYKGSKDSAQKKEGSEDSDVDDNALDDVPASLEMARPSFHGQIDRETETVRPSTVRRSSAMRRSSGRRSSGTAATKKDRLASMRAIDRVQMQHVQNPISPPAPAEVSLDKIPTQV